MSVPSNVTPGASRGEVILYKSEEVLTVESNVQKMHITGTDQSTTLYGLDADFHTSSSFGNQSRIGAQSASQIPTVAKNATLQMAAAEPAHKNLMIRLVMNLLVEG